MWNDLIIEEIHSIRKEHAEKFNYDLDAIVKDYQRQQKQSGRTFLSFQKQENLFDSFSQPTTTIIEGSR
jgi:hypothetical protein